MVQESTMICVDNSNWMRNGDFTPTRLQCQQDAANLILQCKLRANPENAVGVLSMAETVEVLSTMTQDNGKLFMKLHQVEPRGISNFINGIKVAHLALKHRQNRNHKMRIVLFVGSPIDHIDSTELTRLAKKLKKEKVQVDVICFGEADSQNSEIMGQFVETINGRDGSGSNLVVVSSGSTLTEALASSAVCRGEDGAAAPVVAPGGGGFEFGIDPEDDPDLALALRVSLEEQRQRQQQETTSAAATVTAAPTSGTHTEAMDTADVMNMDPALMSEEQQLEWALRMSMQEGTQTSTAATSSKALGPTHQTDAKQSTQAPVKASKETDNAPSEEMEVDVTPKTEKPIQEDDQLGQLMSNPELLRQLVAELPGVDPNSQEVQEAVNNAAAMGEKEKSKKNEEHHE